MLFRSNATNNLLNAKFAGGLFNNGSQYLLDEMYTSLYNGIDWKNRDPKGYYDILNDLLVSLGCILYLDNNDCKWTILMINEIANRENNEVPYVEYTSEDVYVGTGTIEFNSSINLGLTDLVWRDKNQIVTLKKPYNSIVFEHPHIPKNLSRNYSFQEDLIHSNWTDVGTFTSDVDTLLPTSINYDKNYLDITTNENTVDPLGISDYIEQVYNFQNTPVEDATGQLFAIYASYTGRANYRGQGSGYNYQVINTNQALVTLWFDASQAVNIAQDGGLWVTSTGGRLPVFGTQDNGYQRISCYTKYTIVDNIFRLRYLAYRTANGVAGGYTVDEVVVNLTPIENKFLEKFSNLAGFYSLNLQNISGRKNINTTFHGGRYSYDWYVFEGAIGLDNGIGGYYCNRLWDRVQESHDESSFGGLTEITARSVLQYYGRTSRKITGNVYGEDISYPKYFEVQWAINRGYSTGVYNSYVRRVNNDFGIVDASSQNCALSFLDSIVSENAKFLMIEASFDYSQSTTLVNIHEDNSLVTGTNYEIFSGVGATTTGQGVFPTGYGGSNNGVVDSEGE